MRENHFYGFFFLMILSFALLSSASPSPVMTFSSLERFGSGAGVQQGDAENAALGYETVRVYCDHPSPAALGLPPDSAIVGFGGPRMGDEVIGRLRRAAEQGRVSYGVGWWGEPGMVHHNPLDIFYNESFRDQVYQIIDYNFHGVPPDFYHGAHEWSGLDPELIEMISMVGLSGEEPLTSYSWTDFYGPSENLARYGDIYYEETGFQLKGFNDMNETEQLVFSEWNNEKNVWVFNDLYDYVKLNWPHVQVYQNMFLDTSAVKCAVYELKADAFMIDVYLTGRFDLEDGQWRLVSPWKDNPWILYEVIRRYKTMLPEKEFHIVLWGSYTWPWEGEFGGFEHIRRNAWVAYLAGADAVGWFTWDPEGEEMGNRLLMYTTRLNRELVKLPVVKPQPQVLAITGEYVTFPELGLFSDMGLFTEYDVVDQRFFAETDMDLSKYELIAVAQWKYYDETVQKLNDYVVDGGNVVFLYGTGWSPYNVYGNETRETRFLVERDAVQTRIGGHVRINITRPNLLDLELSYDAGDFDGLMLRFDDANENYHPIGGFHQVEEDGEVREIDGHPLVLYHDASNPSSGWILYWGLSSASRTPGFSWENREDVVDTNFLYREVCRAFALNFLNMNGSVSSGETENVLITQSKLSDETVLAGLSNFNFENRSITYSLDLDHFGLPDGEYWVHSLDENATLGLFESTASILDVPVHLPGDNATKLLLISRERPEPPYSVEIYPGRPGVDDIPSASFKYLPADPSMEDSVRFYDTSTDSDGAIISWDWEFGDGMSDKERHPSHQYGWKGEYPVRLTVMDDDGGIDTVIMNVTIRNLPPEANFSYYPPQNIKAGQEVYFTDVSTDPDGSITAWSWDFGDDATSTEQNPAHFFMYPASYAVTLSVEDNEGLEGSYSTTIVVEPILMQVAAQLSALTVAEGDAVTITVEVKDDVNTPIEGATVMASFGDEVIALSDQGDGFYEGTIDTSIAEEGTHEIIVTSEKVAHAPAQASIFLNVEVETPSISYEYVVAVVLVAFVILYVIKKKT